GRPAGTYLVDAGAGLIAYAQHLKHDLQRLVAAFADATTLQLITRYQQRAGIRKFEAIKVTIDDYTALSAVVGMNQRVDQRFLQSFVYRCSRDAIPFRVFAKWTLDPRSQR